MQLFLDCDGVLADFDGEFTRLFGVHPRVYEKDQGAFWDHVENFNNFYRHLPLMPDAMDLYEAVKVYRPIILTGVPHGEWAEIQKIKWAEEHFPGVPLVTCRSKHKNWFCQPGDVLIDDLKRYRHLWQEKGGVFILHTSAQDSIAQFQEYERYSCR